MNAIRTVFAWCVLAQDTVGVQLDVQPTELNRSVSETPLRETVPSDARWEPRWRDKGDCGPVSLYVLMRLAGKSPALLDVKETVPYDSDRGCSLLTLRDSAAKLGFATDVRFFTPEQMRKAPFPLIGHAEGGLVNGTGHFLVLTRYSPENRAFGIINTDEERFYWSPERNVFSGLSGFVLIPKLTLAFQLPSIAGWTLIIAGTIFAILATFRRGAAVAKARTTCLYDGVAVDHTAAQGR